MDFYRHSWQVEQVLSYGQSYSMLHELPTRDHIDRKVRI
ncbi:hypothetical protein L479_01026 [Exiguobacterium sp. S17]|nr:hypothetical protein L479_01026 [Exiguobacterium sp. S17]